MRHIRLVALALFILALPAQAFAWNTPFYDTVSFCEDAMSQPELLEESMREVFEPSPDWMERIRRIFFGDRSVEQCFRLETQINTALIPLSFAIEANIPEDDIIACEESSLTREGNGSYYKLASCFLDIEQRQRALRNEGYVLPDLPLYNFLAFCREKAREGESLKQEAYSSCLAEENTALIHFVQDLSIIEPSRRINISLAIIRDCDKKIGAEKDYKSYHRLYSCALERVKAERRRRRQEFMQEER